MTSFASINFKIPGLTNANLVTNLALNRNVLNASHGGTGIRNQLAQYIDLGATESPTTNFANNITFIDTAISNYETVSFSIATSTVSLNYPSTSSPTYAPNFFFSGSSYTVTLPIGTCQLAGFVTAGSTGDVLEYDATTGLCTWVTPSYGTGTVTSVTFTGDGTVFSSTPSSAVTTSGTVTAALKTQTTKTFLAGPTSGSAATPTFRTIAVADVPTLNQNTSGSSASCTGNAATATLASTVTTNANLTGVITSSGNATSYPTQSANKVLAGPTSGSAAAPTFRTLVSADVPTLNQDTTGTATGITAGNVNVPACNVYNSSADTIAASGQTQISFQSKTFDIGSYFNTTTSKYTPLKAGVYNVYASTQFSSVSTGYFVGLILKNGSGVIQGPDQTVVAGNSSAFAGGLVEMNGTTDYLTFNVGASSLGGTTFPGATANYFCANYVGPSS